MARKFNDSLYINYNWAKTQLNIVKLDFICFTGLKGQ